MEKKSSTERIYSQEVMRPVSDVRNENTHYSWEPSSVQTQCGHIKQSHLEVLAGEKFIYTCTPAHQAIFTNLLTPTPADNKCKGITYQQEKVILREFTKKCGYTILNIRSMFWVNILRQNVSIYIKVSNGNKTKTEAWILGQCSNWLLKVRAKILISATFFVT